MQIVEDEYAQVHPGSLERVHLMYNTAKLEPLVKEYKQLQQSLEDIVDDIKFRKRHGKPVKPKQVGFFFRAALVHESPPLHAKSGSSTCKERARLADHSISFHTKRWALPVSTLLLSTR